MIGRSSDPGAAWGALISVVIDEYDALPALRELRAAAKDIEVVLGRAGFRNEALIPRDAVQNVKVITDSIGNWRPEFRRLVLVWSGHGRALERDEFYLLCADSPLVADPDPRRAVSAAHLGSMIADLNVGETVLLLNACGAGGGAAEIVQAFGTRISRRAYTGPPPALAVISAASRWQQARESGLSTALTRVLRDGPPLDDSYLPWTDRDSHISPGELAQALRVALLQSSGDAQVPDLDMTGIIGRFFPNPRHRPTLPDGDLERVGVGESRSAGLSPDAAEHFMQKFRGIDSSADQGWFFTGRVDVLQQLVTWLRHGSGMKVVSGPPGCGKSAVLGRLAVLSFPEYRERIVAESDVDKSGRDGTIPPAGAIDVGLHARGKSLRDCVLDLRVAYGLTGRTAAASELIAQIGALPASTIVVDALDEAQDSEIGRIAAELLKPLAELPHARVLVGTRPGGPGRKILNGLGVAESDVLWLDRDTQQVSDVAGYASARLRASGSVYADGPDEMVRRIAERIAVHSNGVFLLARLICRTLSKLGSAVSPDSPAMDNLFAGGIREAFVTDLARFGPDLNRARDLLRALAWAEGRGMPSRDVWLVVANRLSGHSYDQSDLGWLAGHAGALVIASSEDAQTVFRLYHEAFGEYFREGADPRAVQGSITTALVGLVDADGGKQWGKANPYILRHLSAHAAKSGRIGQLMQDPGFLVHSVPDRLMQVLGPLGADHPPLTRVYLRCAGDMTGLEPSQRAALFAATALRDEPEAIPLVRDRLDLPWQPLWSRTRRSASHRAIGRHSYPVLCLASGRVGPDLILASGGGDHVVRLWDATSGASRGIHTGHRAPIFSVGVGSIGGRGLVVSGDAAGEIWVGEIATGRSIASHKGASAALAIELLTTSAASLCAAVADHDGRIRVYRLPDLELLADLSDHHSSVRALCTVQASEGRSLLVSGGDDGYVRVWDTARWEAVQVIDTTGHVLALAAAERDEGPAIAMGGYWGAISLWSASEGRHLDSFSGHAGPVNAVSFGRAADGRSVLATAGDDGGVRIWDPADHADVRTLNPPRVVRRTFQESMLRQGIPLTTSRGFVGSVSDDQADEYSGGDSNSVLALRFLAGAGTRGLATGGIDGSVRIWDMKADDDPASSGDLGVTAICATVVDRRPTVVLGRRDGEIAGLDVASGQVLFDVGGSSSVRSLAAGRLFDRECIAVGGDDRRLVVRDAATGEPFEFVAAFRNKKLPVYCAAFSTGSDGVESLVHTTDFASVALLSTRQPARRFLPIGESPVRHLALQAGGEQLLATAEIFGPVRLSTLDGRHLDTIGADDYDMLTCSPLFGGARGQDLLVVSSRSRGIVIYEVHGTRVEEIARANRRGSVVQSLALVNATLGHTSVLRLLVGGDDGSLVSYEPGTGEIAEEFPQHSDGVRVIMPCSSPEGLVVVSGGDGGIQAMTFGSPGRH